MIFTVAEKKVIWKTLRHILYFILTGCFIFSLWRIADCYRKKTFIEFGIVENMQLGFLLISAAVFFIEGMKFPANRRILFLFAGLCLLGGCRELDSYFDERLPFISWKFGFLFPAAALISAYRDRKMFRKSLFSFCESYAFNIMCMAILIGLVVAQVLGHRSFIAAVIGDERVSRSVRRIIEESMELMAYFLIFLSSVECYWGFLKDSRSKD